MATVDDLLYHLRSVKGSPYKWYENVWEQWWGPPEYMRGWEYSAQDVIDNGINCSGLFNWGLTQLGLDPVGGTEAYWERTVQEIDPNSEALYPPGWVVVGMGGQQGHMAMIAGPDNLLIQADTYYGNVNENHYLWTQQPYLAADGLPYTWVGPMPGLEF